MYSYNTIADLSKFEKEHNVWNMKFLEYPLWVHCREGASNQGINIVSVFYRPNLRRIIISTYDSLKFIFSQKRYNKVYFLADRVETVQIYTEDTETKKILFLHQEQKEGTSQLEHIDASFFNIVRYIFRKITYGAFFIRYRSFVRELANIGYDESRFVKIKNAMGDALFLKCLSFVLRKNVTVFYAGAVVPAGEKFINRLNSCEVQHGVIHSQHVGYVGIPNVKNKLIVYAKRYEKLLRNHDYKGQIEVNTFKQAFLTTASSRNFTSVIYTQPIEAMQKSIKDFFKKEKREGIYIQKHPQDFYNYEIPSVYFAKNTVPSEVDYPVCYTSTIIENFTLLDRECYIYDIQHDNIDLDNFLSLYTEETEAKLFYFYDLESIYKDIKKKKVN